MSPELHRMVMETYILSGLGIALSITAIVMNIYSIVLRCKSANQKEEADS